MQRCLAGARSQAAGAQEEAPKNDEPIDTKAEEK